LIIGGLAGLDFSGAFVSFVRHSNTLDFCISCHEMRGTVYEEYAKTTHDENTSGVRALFSDCHVAHNNWVQMVSFKVKATRKLVFRFVGVVDTKEKFEAERLEMAHRV